MSEQGTGRILEMYDDAEENLFVIYEYQDEHGLYCYQTADGDTVNSNEDGTFDILSTDPRINETIRVHRKEGT